MNLPQAEQFLLSLHQIARPEYLVDRANPTHFLERMQKLLDLLGNPEQRIPHYIHVAGTSGKGSVCLMLESILRADKRRVGLFTSPGLNGPRSHFSLQGNIMPTADFIALVQKIKRALENYLTEFGADLPSYFEVLTALGLTYFAQQKVTWAILEVGLGGRYDSTNIIPHKDVAIITTIGLDHTAVLGKTKSAIAWQKAGIITTSAPVFTAESSAAIRAVFAKACQQHTANLIRVTPAHVNTFSTNTLFEQPHQSSNAALAAAVATHLEISPLRITKGLRQVKLSLRLEIINKKPLVIADGAHNPDKIRTTVRSLAPYRRYKKSAKLWLIIGFAGDKDIKSMITELATLHPDTIICTRFTTEKHRSALNPGLLAALLKKYLPRTKRHIFLDPEEALAFVRTQVKPADTLLITGSLFLASQLKNAWQGRR